MSRIYYQDEVDMGLVQRRRVAIIGYGSQAHAQALNLRDSGVEVRVGLRAGSPSEEHVRADGFPFGPILAVSDWADVVALLLPDQAHGAVFPQVEPTLGPGKTLLVAHGFSVVYGQVVPPAQPDVILVAPVSPGRTLRQMFLAGQGVPAEIAVHQNPSGQALALALAYAAALGSGRAGIIATEFRQETETDLFGEQAILCGGIPELIKAGWETLVEAGYPPELAYFECVHQAKLIVDLIYEGGLEYLYRRISDTAEFGAYQAGPHVIDGHVRASLRQVLASVQDGSFARRWIDDFGRGAPLLHAERQREAERNRAMEEVGQRLRTMLDWNEEG